jgi:beta-glucosidase
MSKPLYPFGYGLSYAQFNLCDAGVDKDIITEDGIKIKLHISNEGVMKARDTVQVYVKAEREGTPNPQLKAFTKVELEVGQVKEVILDLPLKAFCLSDKEGRKWVEPGIYSIYIGDSQPDRRSVELTGKEPIKLSVGAHERFEII